MRDKMRLLALCALIAGCHCKGGPGGTKDSHDPIRNGKAGAGGGDRACAGDGKSAAVGDPAPYVPPAIPAGTYRGAAQHPRLFWTPDRLARAKAWVDKTSFHPKDDDILGNAMLCATSKDAGAAKIAIGNLEKVLAQDLFKSDDQARWQGENAIVTYDWCFDQIAPATRTAFEAYANKWFDHWNHDDWGGVGHEEGNYYWGYLRNSLEWALASSPENAQAPALLEDSLVKRWEKSFLPYAQGLQKGGIPTEGTQYGRYQENYPLIAFVTLANGGRKIFDETDWYRGVVYYNIHNILPGVTKRGSGLDAHDMFPAQDDEFWINGGSALDPEYGNLMTAVAWQWADKPVGKHARLFLDAMKAERSPYFAGADGGATKIENAGAQPLPLDYYAPGPGYLWARNKWANDATILFAQLGFARGSGHQQYDAGTFQLWRKGRWLTRETTSYSDVMVGYGGEGKEDPKNTIGHNGLLFGGKGAATGYQDGWPVVTRLESRKDYAYGATDMSKMYRSTTSDHTDRDDNPFAKSVVREMVYLRDSETLVVFDRMESGDASIDRRGWSGAKLAADKVPRTFVVHFEQGVDVKTTANTTVATNGDQVLRVLTLVPADVKAKLVDERLKPDDKVGQQRLELEAPTGSAQGYFLTVLQARDAKGTDVAAKVAESATQFVVTVGGNTITFDKGMESKGGTIATASCPAAHPLADYVQNIRVTDDGPIWGP